MKLPIRFLAVNASAQTTEAAPPLSRRSVLLVAPLVAAVLSGGCLGPIIKRAPYRKHPESIRAGSLIGPFEGRVVDADTRKPLEGTLVWCSWAFDRGIGSPAPEAMRSKQVFTDPDGRYRIPRLKAFPVGLSTRLASFSLVITRPGYVAYRHDRRFNARARRFDFSQLGNVVRLVRWSPELSHARHLLFLGGPPGLRRANRSSMIAAAAELDGARRRGQLRAPLPERAGARLSQARLLLTSDDVRAVTRYTGSLKSGRLANQGDAHHSLHFRAVDREERYDVAVRLWRLSGAELGRRYEALLNALPGSRQDKHPIADRSFVVVQGQILGLGLADSSASALVLLTCGKGQCTSTKLLRALASRVKKNLHKLPALQSEDD